MFGVTILIPNLGHISDVLSRRWLQGSPKRVGELHRDGIQDPLNRPQSFRLESRASLGQVTKQGTKQPSYHGAYISFLDRIESHWEPSCKWEKGEQTQRGSLISDDPHLAQRPLPSWSSLLEKILPSNRIQESLRADSPSSLEVSLVKQYTIITKSADA